MKIEIWSDIMCPFCYIGKRQLESALVEFPNAKFEIEWKSFQLDPSIKPQPNKDIYTFLAEHKGISLEQSKEMHQNVAERAKSVGLDYDFDKVVISNSLSVHRILHLAKAENLANEMEEVFFKAYFTEGKDLNNVSTLIELGVKAGLPISKVQEVVETEEKYLSDVKADIAEAQEIGVQGVPFFVFDRKYAISGAQSVDAFVRTITEVLKN